MSKQRVLVPGALALGLLSACSGGGGGGSGSSTTMGVTAPSDLSYPIVAAVYLVGVPVQANEPSVTGTVTAWSAAPPLPAGLGLDATGTLSGTPTGVATRTAHTITAANSAGSVDFEVEVGVTSPPRFAFVSNASDGTISIYTVDALTGELRTSGFQEPAPGEAVPEGPVPHPLGRFVYAPHHDAGEGAETINGYEIDTQTGRLTRFESEPTGAGPHRMVFDANGDFAYVAAAGAGRVFVYGVDSGTGHLTSIGSSVDALEEPLDIALDPSGRFAFVADRAASDIVIYDVGPNGALTQSVAPLSLPAFTPPSSIAVDPDGRFVYATLENEGANVFLLVQLAVDASTGALTVLGSRPVGAGPCRVSVHPTGRLVYVSSEEDDSVWGFRLDPDTGSLVPTDGARYETGDGPACFCFDPSGLYAFVANRGTNDLSSYAIDLANGDLTLLQTLRGRGGPSSIAMNQGLAPVSYHAKYLYVANEGDGTVTGFAVGQSDGALTLIEAPVPVGNGPNRIANDPYGRFVYVVNGGDKVVVAFRIEKASGALVQPGFPLPFPIAPTAVAVDPSGRFAFVALDGTDEDRVGAFAIDQQDGQLVPLGGQAEQLVGSAPASVSVDPTGQFLYVVNAGSNNVSSFRIKSDGDLVAVATAAAPGASSGTIRFAPRGDYAFLPLGGGVDVVASYTIDPAMGQLAVIPPGNAVGQEPTSIALHPRGRLAYVTDSDPAGTGHIASLTVDVTTGRLDDLTDTFVGLNPRDAVVDPSGRFLYVANELGDDVTIFAIDTDTGALSERGVALSGSRPVAMALTRVID